MDEKGRDLNRLARLEREVARLRQENARLMSLLEQHGIDGKTEAGREEPAIPVNSGGSAHVSLPAAAEKIALFRRLFRGRTDVYPLRWESQSGKSGYSPACANEWRPGVCEKPRIKCAACGHRRLIPVTDPVIYDHLAGKHTIGVYPLLEMTPATLPPPLANRLIRLAAFQNPEFYQAQAMRLPVWNKPRVIGCAENYPQHIALPRGCLDAVVELLKENGIELEIHDERLNGEPIEASFAGRLRPDQENAASALLAHDIGVLCAPTAFGKTVTAAAIIARRGVNTLVLVHRIELLGQWRERLCAFLDVGNEMIGVIGGGQRQPTGKIDIAVMQSLSRKGEIDNRIEGYGQVIVDECHHLSAFSFEAILKRARARYVLGLTATPLRRDGQHPILFMQCGPVRHTALRPQTTPSRLSVWPRQVDTRINITTETGIQERFRQLAADPARNARIVADTLAA